MSAAVAMEMPMTESNTTGSSQQSGDYPQQQQSHPEGQGQSRYAGIMSGPAMTQQHAGPTPTLNQLLTQNQQQPPNKYGASPYPMSGNASGGGQYDANWQNNMNQQRPTYPPHINPQQMHQQQHMGASPMQQGSVGNGPHMPMYDRGGQGMAPPYSQYNMQQGYRRGSNPGYQQQQQQQHPPNEQHGGTNEMNDIISPGLSPQQQQQQRNRQTGMLGQHSGMMGPPRIPGSHHVDGSQMMPPPSTQGFPGMNPQFGGQQQQQPPRAPGGHQMYGNYHPGQGPNAMMSRMPSQNPYPGQNTQQQPMAGQHVNGPMGQFKPMPSSPGQPKAIHPSQSTQLPQGSMSPHMPQSPVSQAVKPESKSMPPSPSPSLGQKSMPPSPRAGTPKSHSEQSPVPQSQASPIPAGPSPKPDKAPTPKVEPDVSPRPDNQSFSQQQMPAAQLPGSVPAASPQQQHQQQQQQTTSIQPQQPTQTLPGVNHSQQQQAAMPGASTSQFHPNSGQMPSYGSGPNGPQGGHPGYAQQQQQQTGHSVPFHSNSVNYPNQQPGQTAMPFPTPTSQAQQPYLGQQGPNAGPYPQQQSSGSQYPAAPGQWLQPDQRPGDRSSPAVFNKSGVNSPMPNVGSPNMHNVASPRPKTSKRPPSVAPSPTTSGLDDKSRSPSWPGTPKSNSTSGQAVCNPEIVAKQMAFGEEPERKPFMDHLCMFYSEINLPLTTVPTMGKTPLDLWKCYVSVKERGGFQQVCKRKQWKQVGNLLTVGASTNAAFTLKKAYIKYLLAYECRFERGGIDPQTVLAAVDTKKDKRTAPSPAGSSNSQDAFMRNQQPGFHPEYGPGGHMGGPQHPNQQNMHMQMVGGPYQPDPMQQQQQHYMGYNGSGMPNGMPNHQQHGPMPPHGPPHHGPMPHGAQPHGTGPMSHPLASQQPRPQYGMPGNEESFHGAPGETGDRFRQQQPQMISQNQQYPHQQQGPHPGGAYPQQRPPYYNSPRGMPPNSNHMRPPFHQQNPGQSAQHPRMRMPGPHHPPHSQPGYPPMYRDSSYPSSEQSSNSQPMSSYPSGMDNRSSSLAQSSNGATPQISSSQQLPHHPMSKGPMRYASPMRPTFSSNTPRGALSQMLTSSAGFDPESLNSWSDIMPPPPPPESISHDRHNNNSGSPWPMRGPRPPMRDGAPPGYDQAHRRAAQIQQMRHASAAKKEMVFPVGSAEAKRPNEIRRKMLLSKDLGKVDPMRLIMCLKSGLLCESVWALDALTILLRDNTTVQSFALSKLPTLLEVVLVHYKQSLSSLFEELLELKDSTDDKFEFCHSEPEDINPEDHEVLLKDTNFTLVTRKGMKVVVEESLRENAIAPDPAMYGRKYFKNDDKASILLHTFEAGDDSLAYKRKFYGTPDVTMCERTAALTRDLLKDDISIEDSNESVQPDNGSGCDGDVKPEPSGEKPDSIKTESPDSNGLNNQTTELNEKSSTPAQPELSLPEIEEKLRHSRKRRFSDTIDEEPVIRDRAVLQCDVDLKEEEMMGKCVTISNIIRSLSFIPGNDKIFGQSQEILHILGQILQLKLKVDACNDSRCWWWDGIDMLREDTLITLSNIAGHIDLMRSTDKVCLPLLDSLLFWATSPSAYSKDGLPNCSHLTAQHLVMEILCKLCAHSDNIDLLLATPSWDRMMSLFNILTRSLSDRDQVQREFAIVIISCLALADPNAARGLALQPSCTSMLITVLEAAESAAMTIAQQQGIHALRDNPDSMGTSLDMIRRTAVTLSEMAKIPENICIMVKQQDRLLNLVMSQILDQHVAKMLSDVLFECNQAASMPDLPLSIRDVPEPAAAQPVKHSPAQEEADEPMEDSETTAPTVTITAEADSTQKELSSPGGEKENKLDDKSSAFMNSVAEQIVATKEEKITAKAEAMVC